MAVSGAKSNIKVNKNLMNRIWFTVFVIFVYRMGTYIPIPGVNPLVLKDFFNDKGDGLLGIFDMFTGGAMRRMTIFALNIMPYIASSIIIQLLSFMLPSLMELRKEGESGRRQINQYTRILTLVVCIIQGSAIAFGLQSLVSGQGVVAVSNPSVLFIVNTTVTLTAGTFFVLWLGEKITERGVGNGVSLIIFSGIVANLPSAIFYLLDMGKKGNIPALGIIGVFVMVFFVIFFVVAVETAQRKIMIQQSRKQVGNKLYGGGSSYLPLKINAAGAIPPIFATSLLIIPVSLISFVNKKGDSIFLNTIASYMSRGAPLYMLLYALLIIFFTFFYISIIFNAEETSENLRSSSSFIPGIRPGEATKNYLNQISKKLTFICSIYLVIVCLLPEFLISKTSIPFYFGGTSLLIIVSVTIDTIAQVQSHLFAGKYESVIKKSKLGGKR